jgi:hypothetical protein
MMVAASEVTKSRPRWLITSLFLPAHTTNRYTCPIANIVLDALTIWTIARSHEVSELIDGLDISEHGIIEPLKMLDDVS